jgi:hypothetical protein
MDDDLVRGAWYMTVQLAVLSAAVHAVVAAPRLAAALTSGTTPRVATLLFVLAVAGVAVALVGHRTGLLPVRTAYALLLAVMAGQALGWLVYHNLDLLGFGHSHGGSLLANTYAHFVADPLEAAAVSAEVMATALLLALLRADADDGRTRTDADPGPGDPNPETEN